MNRFYLFFPLMLVSLCSCSCSQTKKTVRQTGGQLLKVKSGPISKKKKNNHDAMTKQLGPRVHTVKCTAEAFGLERSFLRVWLGMLNSGITADKDPDPYKQFSEYAKKTFIMILYEHEHLETLSSVEQKQFKSVWHVVSECFIRKPQLLVTLFKRATHIPTTGPCSYEFGRTCPDYFKRVIHELGMFETLRSFIKKKYVKRKKGAQIKTVADALNIIMDMVLRSPAFIAYEKKQKKGKGKRNKKKKKAKLAKR